jgi:hypothetical protein
MDTRKTLKTFAWPPAIFSIVVSAYLPPGHRETSPTGVTPGRTFTLKCGDRRRAYPSELPGGKGYCRSSTPLPRQAGTSAVAPLWAALITRINQRLGQRVGFINPQLYANPNAFNDVTLGNNIPGGGNQSLGYDGTQGWDACSGLGSPIGGAVEGALTAQ